MDYFKKYGISSSYKIDDEEKKKNDSVKNDPYNGYFNSYLSESSKQNEINRINDNFKSYEANREAREEARRLAEEENRREAEYQKAQDAKPFYQKIPLVSDAIGGIISGIGGGSRTFNEWDYKSNMKSAERFLKLSQDENLPEEVRAKNKALYEKEKNIAENRKKTFDNISDEIIKYGEKYNTVDRNAGLIERVSKGAASSLGNIGGSLVTGGGTPLVGMGVNTYGQVKKEALDKGMSEEEATKYASANALIESGSELVLPGASGLKSFAKGEGLKAAIEAITKEASEEGLKGFLKSTGKEGIQEALTEVAQMGVDTQFRDGDGNKLSDYTTGLEKADQILTAGLSGALLGGVTNGAGHIINRQNRAPLEVNPNNIEQVVEEKANSTNGILNNIAEKTQNANGQEVYTTKNGTEIRSIFVDKFKEAAGLNIDESMLDNQIEMNTQELSNKEQSLNETQKELDLLIEQQGAEKTLDLITDKFKNNEISESDYQGMSSYIQSVNQMKSSEITENQVKSSEITENQTESTLTENDMTRDDKTRDKMIKDDNKEVKNSYHEKSSNKDYFRITEEENSLLNNNLFKESSRIMKEKGGITKVEEFDNGDTLIVGNKGYFGRSVRIDKNGNVVNNPDTNAKVIKSHKKSSAAEKFYNQYAISEHKQNSLKTRQELYNKLVDLYSQEQTDSVKNQITKAMEDSLNREGSDALFLSEVESIEEIAKNDAKNFKKEGVADKNKENTMYANNTSQKSASSKENKKMSKFNEIVSSKEFKDRYPSFDGEFISKPTGVTRQIEKLARKLKKDVIFYTGKDAPNGFIKGDSLFINENATSDSQVMQVFGHELYHSLKGTKEFNELVEWGKENFTTKEINKFLDGIENDSLRAEYESNPDLLVEEMLADSFGVELTNKSFWTNLKNSNAPLFEKIKNIISRIFNKVEKLDNDFLTKKHIKELKSKFKDIFGDFSESTSSESKQRRGFSKDDKFDLTGKDDSIRFSARKKKAQERYDKREEAKAIMATAINQTSNKVLTSAINKTMKAKLKGDIDIKSEINNTFDIATNQDYSTEDRIEAIYKYLDGKYKDTHRKDLYAISKYIVKSSDIAFNIAVNGNVITTNKIVSSKKEKAKKNLKEEFAINWIDVNTPLARVSKEVYNKATLASTYVSRLNFMKGKDGYLMNMSGEKVGESLHDLVREAIPRNTKKAVEFMDYIYHKHNIDRAREGKSMFAKESVDGRQAISSEESAAIVMKYESLNPDWAKNSKRMTDWVDTFMREWGVESGLINADFYNSLRETYKNYLPANRDFTAEEERFVNTHAGNGKGFTNVKSPIKRAEESSRNILDVVENISMLMDNTVKRALKNKVGQEFVYALETNPLLETIAQIVPQQTDTSIQVMVEGNPVFIEIYDSNIMDAMENINNIELNDLFKYTKKASNFMKRLITTENPLFAVTNGMRDLQSYMINTKNKGLGLKYLGKAIKHIKNDSKEFQLFKAMGVGASTHVNETTQSKTAENIRGKETIVDENGAIVDFVSPNKLKKALNATLEWIADKNEFVESVPRFAEFLGSLERGESVDNATLDAMDVTTNFSKRGRIANQVDAIVPYFNAGVQGMSKLAKQLGTDKKTLAKTLIRAGLVTTLPSLAMIAMYGGDDDYEELSDRVKNENYLIRLSNGKFFKIPKSREYGILFGSLLQRTIEDGYDGFKSAMGSFLSNATPDVTNFVFTPLMNTLSGNEQKKDWAGRYIIPRNLQGLDAKDQWDENTSELSKLIGKVTSAFGISPIELDYFIDSYFGIVGDVVISATTKKNYTDGRTPVDFAKNKFIANSNYSNQNVEDFYDAFDEVKKKVGSEKMNSPKDEASSYTKKANSLFLKASKDISTLNKKVKSAKSEEERQRYKQQISKIAKDTTMKSKKFLNPRT